MQARSWKPDEVRDGQKRSRSMTRWSSVDLILGNFLGDKRRGEREGNVAATEEGRQEETSGG
jgi:hypothetical protein